MARLIERAEAPLTSPLESAADRSGPAVAIVGLALSLAAAAAHFLPLPDSAASSAARLVVGALVVGLLPGLLTMLLVLKQRRFSALELLGLGAAIGFGVAQLIAMLAISLHIPAGALSVVMPILLAVGFGLLLVRGPDQGLPTAEPHEMALLALFALVAGLAYIQGAPVASGEDQIHIAVVRRLAFDAHPTLDNIYYLPGIVYTYPFPGLHFLMALVSRLTNLDPMFTYHKLRFYWTGLALVFVYLGARAVFGSWRPAFAAALTAVCFVLNGTFAQVPGFFWAQLAPYSHVSDVAMNVVLPALLVLAFYFLTEVDQRSSRLYFATALALALMLTISHIREIVQFLVYLGCFLAALLVARREASALRRGSILLASCVATVVLYSLWQSHAIGHVDLMVDLRRQQLVELARGIPWTDWLRAPLLDTRFVVAYPALFYGWFPIVLALLPFALLAYQRSVLVLFVAAGALGYLLIIRLLPLAIPYVYVTYFEILFTPVRNLVPFIYLGAGALLYVAAQRLASLKISALGWAAAVLLAGGVAAFWRLMNAYGVQFGAALSAALNQPGPSAVYKMWNVLPDAYFWPVIGLYVMVLIVMWRRGSPGPPVAAVGPGESRRPWLVASLFGGLLAVLSWWSYLPQSSLLQMTSESQNGSDALPEHPPASATSTSQGLLASFSCAPYGRQHLPKAAQSSPSVDRELACAPPPALVAWAGAKLPADSVLEVNTFNPYLPAAFLPQQIVAFPWALSAGLYGDTDTTGGLSTLGSLWKLTPAYEQAFNESITSHAEQPFMNDRESLADRLQFASRLKISHVLLDPMYYGTMKRTLAQWPDHFRAVYDDGSWVVYEVVAS
ncbi:MAG TPA: hypothetical protein VF157_05080 [Chloroflexota bacterium]